MKNRDAWAWVSEVVNVLRPAAIHWCVGDAQEADELLDAQLDRSSQPRQSGPSDVVSTDKDTFVCSVREDEAGPTNNWMSPADARAKMWPLFEGAMTGRTLYVVPYILGPLGSRHARVGVQLTDDPNVVLHLRATTRMGSIALDELDLRPPFVRSIHALRSDSHDGSFVLHFPETRTIWSIGGAIDKGVSSRHCHGLRIASVEARDEGWFAENMAVFGVRNPKGVKRYFAAAMPSGCGKTTLATSTPSVPGWSIEVVSDAVAWLHAGADGRLWAVNPESGLSAPTRDASARGCDGVPISAILFGARRAHVSPLVYESFDWSHGVYVGATLVTETSSSRPGGPEVARNDPMAMLPFCGYNMADYFGHWLGMGRRIGKPPRIFHVNWFRRDSAGRAIWPGFGENVRVLEWIFERVEGRGFGRSTPIGVTPRDLNLGGLGFGGRTLDALLEVDSSAWLEEADRNTAFFATFGSRFPAALLHEHRRLLDRLRRSIH